MPPTSITCVGDFIYFVPEDGWNRQLLALLWPTRDRLVPVWRLVNNQARQFGTQTRIHERQVRLSIWEDLTPLIQHGWVIRKSGLVRLNPAKLACPGKPRSLVPQLRFPEPEV